MLAFIKARLNERSTWIILGAAIASASQLAYPWSIAALVTGIVSGFIPDGNVKK